MTGMEEMTTGKKDQRMIAINQNSKNTHRRQNFCQILNEGGRNACGEYGSTHHLFEKKFNVGNDWKDNEFVQ